MYRELSSVRSEEPRPRRGKTIENRLGLMGGWKTEDRSRKTGVKMSFRNEVRNLSGVGSQSAVGSTRW